MTARAADAPDIRGVALACLAVAVGCGMLCLAALGAPHRLIAVNGAAFVVGSGAAILLRRFDPPTRAVVPILFAVAAALVATAWAGVTLDGATRWVAAGSVTLQPGLVLVPFAVTLFASAPGGGAAAAVALTAAALALQPDRGTAGALAAATVVVATMVRTWATIAAAGACVAGFAVTLARADMVAPVAMVEGVYRAAAPHPVAAIAALVGTVALPAPAILAMRLPPAQRPAVAAFAAVWVGLILAALLGPYPTPAVGGGASAILGHALAACALPRGGRRRTPRLP